MPLFQLGVSVALVVNGLLSSVLLVFARPEEEKVKLPQFVDLDSSAPLQDPFDVTKAEDIVDGEPIDEAGFWAKVRMEQLLQEGASDTENTRRSGYKRYSLRWSSRLS